MASGEPLVIPDARRDSRVADNGAVGDLGVIAYAGVPLKTADGRTLGAFCAIDGEPRAWDAEDVEALREIAASLDLLVERRFENGTLADALAAADAANRAKSAFLAHMSHEIRTPLNGILGFTDVLRAGGVAPEQTAEYLDTIHGSGRHLLGLVNDVLDLSKIEAGKLEFDPAPCDPHAILCEMLSALRVTAAGKGLSLECAWAGPVPETVLTDGRRLRQVLTNLVGNAVKFTDSGLVKVTGSIDRDGDSPALVMEVRDTGPGIPADRLEAVFETFTQGDASVTRVHGGTGLGLAISRRLADGLGGSLTAESQVGWGSAFTLRIAAGDLIDVPTRPATTAEAVAPAPADSSADLTDDGTPADSGDPTVDAPRVLLVEDGAMNRKLFRVVLARQNIVPTEAYDGRAGVDAALAAAADGRPFDVILMDMQMPALDGYGAAAELRAGNLLTAAGTPVPIVALTAHAMTGERERCLAAGCSDYLTKPVDPADLLARVAAAAAVPGPAEIADGPRGRAGRFAAGLAA